MKTIIESSLPYVAEIEGLSPGAQAYLYAKDAELARRQAIDAAKAQRMRASRTAQCEAKVLAAIHAKRARLKKEPRHNWTSLLMEHYFDKKGIKIDEETVRHWVYEFPGF